ncbi:MAG TPA: DNA-binding response regulator, partial [Syntrophomonas sp.]|nr:DNA-binding response regulator [Syntrophomonas sp.]
MQQLKGIKILVVDDEPNILQFLEIGLQNEGFEVRT